MIRSVRNLSLGIKFTIIIFIIMAMAASVTVVIFNWNATRLLKEVGREQLASDAIAIQSGLAQAEEQTLNNAKLLANSPGLVDAVIAQDTNVVRTIVLTTAASATFDDIIVADAEGNNLTDRTTDVKSADTALNAMLELGLLGIETTGILPASTGSNLMLGGVTPLRDPQGNIIGTLLASQDLDEEFLSAITLQRDDILLVLVHEGAIITSSNPNQRITRPFKPQLLEEARNGRIATDNQIFYSESTPYIQAIIPLGTRTTSEDTVIATYVNLHQLHSFQRQLLIFAGVSVGLVSLILMGIIALFAWRNISVPLHRLQSVAGAMASGDYQQRFEVKALDEVGQLGRAFNTMAGAIRLRDRSLQETNETLENRVRERTQQLEQANREVREASRLKDEFLAIMSHELRTPLNAIIGFQGILEMVGDLSEKNLQRVKRTRANAERLLNLIDDILDISRIESGRLQLVPSEINTRELVNDIHNQMKVLADEKNLVFDVQIDEDVPEIIWIDEDAITKIITNLLANAFKFTSEGKVGVAIKHIDKTWQIQVKDTGIGIPAHMQEIIFERFRQVDGSTKREYGGSGLGLAITRQLIEAIGGNIRVDSVPNQGATFTVNLPLESESESGLMAQPELVP